MPHLALNSRGYVQLDWGLGASAYIYAQTATDAEEQGIWLVNLSEENPFVLRKRMLLVPLGRLVFGTKDESRVPSDNSQFCIPLGFPSATTQGALMVADTDLETVTSVSNVLKSAQLEGANPEVAAWLNLRFRFVQTCWCSQ